MIKSLKHFTIALCFSLAMTINPAAQADTAPLTIKSLLRAELEVVEGIEVIVSMVEIQPGLTLPQHRHPGEEFIYILEGSGSIWLEDEGSIELTPRHIYKVPYEQVHSAMTGENYVKAIVFRVHRKGEPERILIKQ